MPTVTLPPDSVKGVFSPEDSIRGQIIQVLQEQMKNCKSVLELGAGHFEMIDALTAPVRVGVEIHPPYIERRSCSSSVVAIRYDATKVAELFTENSFDGVILIDFIEHLEKDTALQLLDDVARIARKTIFVHCPAGNHPQEGDAFGLGGEEFQLHRSSWEPEELESKGFATVVIDGFFDDKPECDPRAIVAVRRL
ncbi:class I SAM-dependent methyltransferase [bacterium AH-315-J21]|nr:class I SAM-dependent methyltransferase [bacterium AH-315-J21]